MRTTGSKPTSPPTNRSTVWTTSSGVEGKHHHIRAESGGSSQSFIKFFAFCRYLESCTGSGLKRKSGSRSLVTSSSSSASEDDKPAGATDRAQASSDGIHLFHGMCWKAIVSNSSCRVKFTPSWLFLVFQWCWTVGCRWPPLLLRLSEHL